MITNPIIKTPWGDHIDLSQIISISRAYPSYFNHTFLFIPYFVIFDIEYKHRKKKISYHFDPEEGEYDQENSGRRLRDENGEYFMVTRVQKMVDQLVEQWIDYRNFIQTSELNYQIKG